MSNLGVGVMLNKLSGNSDTVKAITTSIGRTIAAISIKDNQLVVDLERASALVLWDDGQSCCETRYMTTDDDLGAYNGAALMDISIKSAKGEHDDHEIEFLELQTSRGVLTVVNHNVHNGYYGGFAVSAKLWE